MHFVIWGDIPNTVGAASKIVGQQIGVGMFNVHASCGIPSMMAAMKNRGSAEVLAVTVLTSLEENDAYNTFSAPSKAKVLQYAREAFASSKVPAVICSPQELLLLDSKEDLEGLKKVTPGIRSSEDPADDQNRTMSPREATRNGAYKLVIGRPITKAKDPLVAVAKIVAEISAGLIERFHASLLRLEKIKFGAFKLKLHEKTPEAPLSPIYFNIRDLPFWLYELAGDVLHDLYDNAGIGDFDYVIGIPNAGQPIGEAFAKAVGKPHLRIKKTESEGGRRITSEILDPFEPGKKVILVDDLVTKADTKREAKRSVEVNGLDVVATLVLYDREQGGMAELNAEGHKIFATAKISQALGFFVGQRKIKQQQMDDVMSYIAAN